MGFLLGEEMTDQLQDKPDVAYTIQGTVSAFLLELGWVF